MMDTPSWTSLQPCNMHSCKSKPNPLTSKIHKNPKLVFEFLRDCCNFNFNLCSIIFFNWENQSQMGEYMSHLKS
jgi:hypothetical protein